MDRIYRIYNRATGDEQIAIDLGKVAAVEKNRDPGIAEMVLLVHFDGGGSLRLFENQHPYFEREWINYVQSFEHEEVTHGR